MSQGDSRAAEWRQVFSELIERVADSPVVPAARKYYETLGAGAEMFARLLPLARDGWTLSTYGTLLTIEAHAEASRLAERDQARAAQRLEDGWADEDARRRLCSLVPFVYPASQRYIALRRQELFERASQRLTDGHYEEAVLLVYSQLDGVFLDVAAARGEDGFRRLFSKTKPAGTDGKEIRQIRDLVSEADSMIGTEGEFFLAIREGMSAGVHRTTLRDHPSRHGVLHGRVLGYGTRRRAAQTFAFLAGCLELLVLTADLEESLTEEELTAPADELPDGAQFILGATLASPVRAVYMHNVCDGKDLVIAEDLRSGSATSGAHGGAAAA